MAPSLFEIHINRNKQNVLGRKSKADRGLPGVARSKAIEKRKHTLLQEYNLREKDNRFVDRRIGERNFSMTAEDRSLARYAAEKAKAHKKNIYSLNDEEVELTHKGQTLEEIEKFEDPRSDDELSDEGEKKGGSLGKKFVEDAHFGGGILSKSGGSLSRAEIIEKLIYESKKRKAEQQKLKEQTGDLTEKLDAEWKDLQPLMASLKRKPDEPAPVQSQSDDYDRAVRELKFESRGTASERLKSQEEIVKEEKDKLEVLEQDRLNRMKGFLDGSDGKTKHKSADDLDDGFQVEEVNEEALAYGEDGLLKRKTKKTVKKFGKDGSDDDNDSVQDENSEDEDEESEAEEDSNEDDDLSDLKRCNASSEDDDDREEEEKEEEEEEEEEETEKEKEVSKMNGDNSKQSVLKLGEPVIFSQQGLPPNSSANIESNPKRIMEIREDLQRRKEVMTKAREELPYTYSAPESYEELTELLKNQDLEHQSIILERIIKCNHWTLGQGNREKLCRVFENLLKYLVNSCRVTKTRDIVKAFQIVDRLCPHLFDLAQADAANTVTCVQNIIKEQQENLKKNPKKYPELDTLILFKLVSLLFPTSDFRHPVVTPCIVFMSQILLRCRVRSKTDISKGLFLVTLMLEYTQMSKRFSPSAINFLRGIVYLATVKTPPTLLPIIPPFKRSADVCNLLVLEQRQRDLIIEQIGAHMHVCDLTPSDIDEEFKVRALLTAVNLIQEFKTQLMELEAAHSIFAPMIVLLRRNNWKNYPKSVKQRIKEVRKDLKSLADKDLMFMKRDAKKPKALRLYEPRIETVYDGKKHRPMSKVKAEREKLMHKLKQETKGAKREIRRDTQFLAKVQIKQRIKSDTERKRKVKEIYGSAADQQGELNKIKRKK